MSPAGTSVNWPMWRYSSVMNDWQKRRTSSSDFPFGSKSDPPLPPPIGKVVSAFLNTCSKARNFSKPSVTSGWKRNPPLYGPIAEFIWTRKPAVHLDNAEVVDPGDAEDQYPLGLDEPLQNPRLNEIRAGGEHGLERFEYLAYRLVEGRLVRVLFDDLFDHPPREIRHHVLPSRLAKPRPLRRSAAPSLLHEHSSDRVSE